MKRQAPQHPPAAQKYLRPEKLMHDEGHRLGWRLGKVGGIELFIHPFFLLFAVLWVLGGLPFETLFLFVLVLGHELSHTLAANLCGLKMKKIELFPFGGVAYPATPLETFPPVEFFVAAAGPAFNLAAHFFLVRYGQGLAGTFHIEDYQLQLVTRGNLFLLFFNLLPALPLDGGRLLRASLNAKLGFYRSTDIAASCGKWLGGLLLGSGLILSLQDYIYLSISLMGIFLYYAAGREHRSAIYTFLRYLLKKESALSRYKVFKGEQLVTMGSTTLLELLKHFKPSRYHQIVVLNRNYRIEEILSESQVISAAIRKGVNVPLNKLKER